MKAFLKKDDIAIQKYALYMLTHCQKEGLVVLFAPC